MSGSAYNHAVEQARRSMADGEFARSWEHWHAAARIAREAQRDMDLAFALRHAAQAGIAGSRFTQAETDAVEARDLYRSANDRETLDEANALRLLALAREGAGRSEQARACWQQARKIYAEAGIRAGAEECDEHLLR